ncbi:copper resistance CopC family protein [Micromonospora sp. NPDC047644]|uniref:copper resistance CopC family protein n=1 Tax=Micromonospora sp. NPDC047644 TaxID=3157203 RepID=UPI003453E505
MTAPEAARSRPGSRWFGYLIAAVVCAVVALAALTDQPSARVAAVTPADGATVAGPPAEVVVTFEGTVRAREFHLAVAPAGQSRSIAAGPAKLEEQRLVLPVRVQTAGAYLAAYHVLLTDGRQLSGTTRFTVAAGGPPVSVAADAPSVGPGGHQHGADDPLSVGLLVLDLLLVVVVAVVLLRRPRVRAERR